MIHPCDRQTYRQTDGQTDRQTNGRCQFYESAVNDHENAFPNITKTHEKMHKNARKKTTKTNQFKKILKQIICYKQTGSTTVSQTDPRPITTTHFSNVLLSCKNVCNAATASCLLYPSCLDIRAGCDKLFMATYAVC